MFNYKLKFIKKENTDSIDEQQIFDKIECYWNALSKNGQVVGGFDVYKDNEVVYLTVVLPTKDSLSDSHNNEYVTKFFDDISKLFDIEIVYEGENIEYYDSCDCGNSKWYYLFKQPFQDESPLICGDCSKPVPLYKIPYIFNEKDHCSLLNWKTAYNSICNLWFYGLWDRFTYSEQSKFNSKINSAGRKICKEIEKKIDKPVYYYLYFAGDETESDEDSLVPKGLQRGMPKLCPKCGGVWLQNEEWCKCDKCRLISDSPNWRQSES